MQRAAEVCGPPLELIRLPGLSSAAIFRYRGARRTLIIKRTSLRERRFYREVRPVLVERGVRTPACHFDLVEAGQAWLGLEHLGRSVPVAAFPYDPAMLGALAALHAVRLPTAPRHLVHAWTEGRAHRVASQYGDRRENVASLLERLQSTPRCEDVLVWGDANPFNWALSDDGHPVLLDWQRWGVGARAFDLATFTPGLGDRAAIRRVADEYRAASFAAGSQPPPLDLLACDIVRAKAWSVLEMLDEPAEPDSFLASEQAAMRPLFAEWLQACYPRTARLPGRRLNVLQVIHRLDTRGGIEEHTRALLEQLRGDIAFTIAVPQATGDLRRDIDDERIASQPRVARIDVDHGGRGLRVLGFPAEVTDTAMEYAFRGLLSEGFDVVHFQSLVGWNTLRLPRLAREGGARVVISAHDLSLLCAEYNMVTGPLHQPCGREAAHGADAGCVRCMGGKSEQIAAPAIARYLDNRYSAACDAISSADAIVCASEFTRDRLHRAFGDLCDGRVVIMPHGVREYRNIYLPGGAAGLRVAFVGRFSDRKGADVMLAAVRELAGHGIAFEVWGPVEKRLVEPARAAGILLHGEYGPGDLEDGLRGVDLVLVPSVMEESFCLVVGEAQRLGIPVAASEGGAMAERVRDGETGFLLPAGDATAIVRLLLALAADRAPLDKIAAHLRDETPKTLAQNAGEYLGLYTSLCAPAPPAIAHRAA